MAEDGLNSSQSRSPTSLFALFAMCITMGGLSGRYLSGEPRQWAILLVSIAGGFIASIIIDILGWESFSIIGGFAVGIALIWVSWLFAIPPTPSQSVAQKYPTTTPSSRFPTPTPTLVTRSPYSEPRVSTLVPPSYRSSSSCDRNYSGCVPVVSYDLDCVDIRYRTVLVLGVDRHGFDGDSDGYGCE